MKKFFEEFKAFALKGNMMDMAIGVIIGGAFSTLVTSLTDNLISPILGILGKVNFDAMMWDVFRRWQAGLSSTVPSSLRSSTS